MIRVQREDFDPAEETNALVADDHGIGGVVTFTGLVREIADLGNGPDGERRSGRINAMTLEHYPGMTEKMLARIEAEALERWPLSASLIIHRYGDLEPGDRIVFVLTASAHRQAAYEANMFLVDWLKTKAPFWKREDAETGAHWVEARDSDEEAAARWSASPPKAAE
ncbi:MAG: molybdenum cofactor biosynthesis protein MoaE [Alphaproteobacteria bacterium]|nr:molybdenum cofactor biosynthesis protein MoaE [Alphaproteobacteria bacterium]